MPNTTGSRKPQRRFQFIDNSSVATTGSGGKSSTQVRRHVMQEYMREKRWEARSKAESTIHSPEAHSLGDTEPYTSVQPSSQFESHPKHKRQRYRSESATRFLESNREASIASTSSGHFDGDDRSHQLTLLPQRRKHRSPTSNSSSNIGLQIDSTSFAILEEMFPWRPPSPPYTADTGVSWSSPASLSPESILSAARTDPFDVLPITLNAKDRELFDFYAVVMPSCSYGFERRHHKAHNWYRDVFIPEAMKGAVTFRNTILVHAANTQAWVQGLDESPLALLYRQRAIESLLAHYAAFPDDASDQIITATMSAAALEDFDPRIERKPVAWSHWSAAMQKIRLAGGPAMLEYKPSLRKLINWQDYIFSGYDGRGSTFYFTPDKILNTPDSIMKENFGREEITRQCEEFLTFLKCTEHLASVSASQMNSPMAFHSQPWRFSVFKQNHPLYVLLASPNKDRYTKSGQLKQIISRLGSLMTINVAIWEYRYDLNLSEAFFEELVNNILYNELDKNISVEALMQILLSGSVDARLQVSERPWLVGRLLKVAKRLSRHSWEWLNDFLLSCLTLEAEFALQMQEWEGVLRQEILSAPIVSYTLPLMQG